MIFIKAEISVAGVIQFEVMCGRGQTETEDSNLLRIPSLGEKGQDLDYCPKYLFKVFIGAGLKMRWGSFFC